jgi:hypothetical protein
MASPVFLLCCAYFDAALNRRLYYRVFLFLQLILYSLALKGVLTSLKLRVSGGKVYRLLGAKDIGVTEDYHTAKMPPVNTGLLDGELAWRQHNGGHTDATNIKYFIEWADKFIYPSGKE